MTKMDRYQIKVPSDVHILYCERNKILTVIGPLKTASLKLTLKILLHKHKKVITVSSYSFFQISKATKKKIKTLQNSTIAKIKHLIIESSSTIAQKLKIVGVGYRLDVSNIKNESWLTLKLGYSHPIFVKAPKDTFFNSFTKTNINVLGKSYEEVTHFSANIRQKKVPDPYKGKGILYENEQPVLKEGKKV